jgi:8-oxo-dGTP pyrophosphatase MutT (NUDIX family)/transcriptional regulator with XRE-family HTH domain
MRMHDLIGAGVAAARQRKRWTQEDAAREFRYHGLTSWRTGTVGQLEAGLRRPRLEEVVLICAALGVALNELLPDSDELIELGDRARMTPAAVRAVLDGSLDKDAEASFPGADRVIDGIARARPERRRVEALLAPIQQYATALTPEDVRTSFLAPADAERHAARRLNIHPAQVKLAARALWHREFADERDARIGDPQELEPRSRQAKRGLVTRAMLAELREYIAAANAAYTEVPDLGQPGLQVLRFHLGLPATGAADQPPIVAAIVTSRQRVLIGRRHDRQPPWTFIAGEQEPGERPEDTIIREVKEETGLDIRAGELIGERDHPATGRHLIYMAARPVRGATRVIVGDEAELAEVRWVSLAEAEELLPDMFGPVREYLKRTLPTPRRPHRREPGDD